MRIRILIAAVCALTVFASARPESGFVLEDLARHARRASTGSTTPGVDAGEFLVDTTVEYIAAPRGQHDPAVAFDGTNYLVAWADARGANWDIYATRVTPGGTLLDPSGIVVASGPGDEWSPAIAFDGTNFLVVWVDDRSDSTDDIYAARVTPEGTVLDADGIAVSTAAFDQEYPAVAFDGTNFLVVWSDDWRSNPSCDVHAARVTPAGVVLDPTGIAVSTAAERQRHPTVAFDGANCLVSWSDTRTDPYGDIYCARMTPQGAVLDPDGIVVSGAANDQMWPMVAFGDSTYLVAWSDNRSSNYSDVYCARVTTAGVVLDPSGIAVSTAAEYQYADAVAFDGTNFCIVSEDSRGTTYDDVYYARVTPQGAVLDPQGIPVARAPGFQYWCAVAAGSAEVLVAWEDDRTDDIYCARVTPQGTVLDPQGFIVSVAAGWQEYPAVAGDGANFLVSWTNGRSDSTHNVYAARVTPEGVVLDSTVIAISAASGWQSDPAIAFDGTNYLVAWMDYRSGQGDIYAARVTPEGTVLDPSGIAVSTAAGDQLYPTIAFDGTNYLITWSDSRDGHGDIYAARVTPQGAVLDPSGIAVSTATSYQLFPAVAFDGTNFLIAWTDARTGSSFDIYCARVTPAGVVLDASGIPVSTESNDQVYPAVAFDGAGYLLVWHDERDGLAGDIYAARVTPQGAILDPSGIPVCTADNEQQYPDVAFDGTNFLAVWQDSRTSSTSDIHCARVTPAGAVFDSGPVVRQDGDQVGPVLARGPGNVMFLAYQGWAGTVGGKTYSTDRIWGKMNPSSAVAEGTKPEVRMTSVGATIVRGVLNLTSAFCNLQSDHVLLDATGRRVMNLAPGPNDVSHLAPGVYFMCAEPSTASDERSAFTIRKVVLTR